MRAQETIMTEEELSQVVERLRKLLERHIKAQKIERASGPRFIFTNNLDIKKFLDKMAEPDPHKDIIHAIWLIGDSLGRRGGFDLMKKVYRALAMRHGNRLGSPLVYCWDGAANRWYA